MWSHKLLCLSFLLSGCVITPVFHSHTQEIDLKPIQQQISGVSVYYDGQKQQDKLELYRSWFDKEIVLKKDGFLDYHLNLDATFTKDTWQKAITIDGENIDIPAGWGFIFPTTGALILSGYVILVIPLVATIPTDITLFAESLITAPVNPWKEYDIKPIQQKITLVPTEELKNSCQKRGYFISNSGCTKCSTIVKAIAADEELNRCSDRFSDPVFSYSCNDKGMIKTTPEECGKCPNRSMIADKCVLSCPKEKPIQGLDGNCYTCDSTNEIITEKKECDRCPDRLMVGVYCKMNRSSFSCDEKKMIDVSPEECSKCPNRYMNDGKCALKCPPDKPMQDIYGLCYACDEDFSPETTFNECSKCLNRTYKNGKCLPYNKL